MVVPVTPRETCAVPPLPSRKLAPQLEAAVEGARERHHNQALRAHGEARAARAARAGNAPPEREGRRGRDARERGRWLRADVLQRKV